MFGLVRMVTPAQAWEGRRCAHTAQLREIFISFYYRGKVFEQNALKMVDSFKNSSLAPV